jgi:hypothetical protein
MRAFTFVLICVPTLALAQGTTSTGAEEVARMNKALTDGNCPEFARLFENQVKLHPPQAGSKRFAEALGGPFDDSWQLNVGAWQVYLRCGDKSTLSRAVEWSEMSIKLAPGTSVQSFDTKAHLLYKMGMREEAIATEEAAVEEDKREAERNGKTKGYFFDEYTATIEKMKKGEPTWPHS